MSTGRLLDPFAAGEQDQQIRIPTCKGCGRRPHRETDTPLGWYNLTVTTPRDVGKRGYVWLGVFCSLKCLALHIPELRRQNMITEDLYERD